MKYTLRALDNPIPDDLIADGGGVAPVGVSLAGWLASQALRDVDWDVVREGPADYGGRRVRDLDLVRSTHGG